MSTAPQKEQGELSDPLSTVQEACVWVLLMLVLFGPPAMALCVVFWLVVFVELALLLWVASLIVGSTVRRPRKALIQGPEPGERSCDAYGNGVYLPTGFPPTP